MTAAFFSKHFFLLAYFKVALALFNIHSQLGQGLVLRICLHLVIFNKAILIPFSFLLLSPLTLTKNNDSYS